MASQRRDELRTVTCLVSDLVAFTAFTEACDPEDVDAVLQTYQTTARKVIESFGGTVEKFVGDAVIGIFGLPFIHEDDAERAVRAGVRLVERLSGNLRVGDRRLRVRVGVKTGEVFVRFGAGSGAGIVVAGDAITGASRLQQMAPPMRVAVGDVTHDLTARRFAFEPAGDGVWIVGAPLPRGAAGAAGDHGVPHVGRDAELSFLIGLHERALAGSAQVALVIGEPGIGKTRLVAELEARVAGPGRPAAWREGRCHPYGERRTYSALGEIVRGHAGILETDGADIAAAKLADALPPGAEGEWLESRLRPLIGLPAPPAERDENHAAWLRFLEAVAVSHPLVLWIEDLHWADEPLLAFLEFLAVHVGPVPLLALATTRPELFGTHPSFATSAARVTRIWLDRLSDEETSVLVRRFPEARAADPDVVDAIVRRSEGNPYFAQELARLLEDRTVGRRAVLDGMLPGSIQAVIAARVDALPEASKAYLGDAAVIGYGFSRDAMEAFGVRDADEAAEAVDDLVLRGLLAHGGSRVAGGQELVFAHGLVRNVTYNSLPRSLRASRHASYATWLEARAGERAGELAAVLAHHFAAAAELAQPEGSPAAGTIARRAVHYLSLEADRMMNLDAAAAGAHYARALALVRPEHPIRLSLLVRWAEALAQEGRYREAALAFEQAARGLREAGERRRAALALVRLSEIRYALGDGGVMEPLHEALALLEGDEPSAESVAVLARWAKALWFGGDPRTGLEAAERALATAVTVQLPVPADLLGSRGGMRCTLGDSGGLDDYVRAIAAAAEQGLERERSMLAFNYSDAVLSDRGPAAAAAVLEDAIAWARGRRRERTRTAPARDEASPVTWGAESIRPLTVNLIESLGMMGRWDESLTKAEELVPQLERGEAGVALLIVQVQRAVLLAYRGEQQRAEPVAVWLTARARDSQIPWMKAYAALSSAPVLLRLGDPAAARDVLSYWRALPRPGSGPNYALYLPEAVRTALAASDRELATGLPSGIEPVLAVQRLVLAAVEALLLEARGEHEAAAAGFAAAAARWAGFTVPYEEAQALLGRGRCLLALGRAPDAVSPLRAAAGILAALGAGPALAEAAGLLEQAGAGGAG